MKRDLPIKNGIIIPAYELELSYSRSGGPGGQHVNKTSTRVTIRWNVFKTQVLSIGQKERVVQKLQPQLTQEGDLIIHVDASRSQQQNRDLAYAQLVSVIKKALHVPKKRMKTTVSAKTKEKRLYAKSKRSTLKKMRKINFEN